MYPEELLYTKDHEWILVRDDVGIVGITEYAQKKLGDVVFVELPDVGDAFDANEAFGSIESVKAVSELFCPVSGEVIEVNETLAEKPEIVNEDSYGDAWMIKLKLKNKGDLEDLMTAEEYQAYIEEEGAD
jgi:glycine cleavage system H protein